MERNAFASIAALQLPSACRLLATACCPDKDLVVLISRLGGKDKMSLWKMQGSKKWDVDVGAEDSSSQEIVDLAWSPNGQTIAVALDPPKITLHSVQDGHEERLLTIHMPSNPQRLPFHLTTIQWFEQEKNQNRGSIPDIFRRGDVITGSAHSILKMLPLLDHLQEDTQQLTATNIFAFQGSKTKSAPKATLPEVIKSWPSLLPDLVPASISPSPQTGGDTGRGNAVNDTNDPSLNSILMVADNIGHVHGFLDGSYSLGAVPLGSAMTTPSIFKDPEYPVFYVHPQWTSDDDTLTSLKPTSIEFEMLKARKPRDMAKLSSTARELVWYIIRVVKDMRAVWFGSDNYSGAREVGPKWVRALETKQQEQFGQEEPNAVLDLTCLLVTGRSSESLVDFLGSGEHMSERGIQKWESTVTEALVKLRDFSEKRVAPACQRLHLILQEVQGWSRLPQYASFELVIKEINDCLDLTGRAIVISSWLAAVVRRELSRFKEFIAWLRYEIAIANPTGETQASPRHDILEVNNYFMSGLVVSSIDKWFMGPVPQFSSSDLGVPENKQALSAALAQVREVLNDPTQIARQLNVRQKDLSHLDRNLDALIQKIATRCERVFARASSAASRSALVSIVPNAQVADARQASYSSDTIAVRERTVTDKNQEGIFLQYLAMHVRSGHPTMLCLARARYGRGAETPFQVGVAMLECREEESGEFELLEVDFFDDESVVIVYRTSEKDGSAFVATATYDDLGYQEVDIPSYVKGRTREDLMRNAIERWKEGGIPSVRVPIKRCRELNIPRKGDISLAVNGRAGRRVACILDGQGTTMEILDLESDGDEEETEEAQ